MESKEEKISKRNMMINKYEFIKSNTNIFKIKSLINIKTIFSFLIEKKKLILIIYNKQIRYKLGISEEKYKKLRRKEIRGERNGKGVEYDLSNFLIIFEGEYKNGKRDGNGKEYEFKKIIFEGEYKEGKRNGKGKEYFNNNKIKFEGEYLNGRKWNGIGYNYNGELTYKLNKGNGTIKEYNIIGKLIFEGEYINGEISGIGKEYNYKGNLIFEGEYKYGKRNGVGIEYDNDGKIIYEGEYFNGERIINNNE